MPKVRSLGAVLMAGAIGTWAIQTPSGPTIVSAFLEGSDLVIFPLDSINWDTLLPPKLQRAAIEQDRAFTQSLSERRSDYGSTEVPFPVPPSRALLSRFYYLFDSRGVHQVRPSGFKGMASVGWRGRSDTIEQVKAYGYVRFQTASDGGFILVAPNRKTLRLEPSALTADSLLSPNGGEYPNKGTAFWKMLRQYQVRMTAPTPDRWVFVQWVADSAGVEAGCVYRFSLFHLQPAPVVVQSTDAGCDP